MRWRDAPLRGVSFCVQAALENDGVLLEIRIKYRENPVALKVEP